MLNRFLPSLVQLFATLMPRQPLARTGYAACLVYAGCLVGSAAAQSLVPLKGTSPVFDPNLVPLSMRQIAPITANAPLSDTFLLHSRPSALKRIYLDFDGFTTTDANWGPTAIVTAAFTLDATAAISDSEKIAIQDIWARVAECFSPFDVDVTTQVPESLGDLKNTGGTDIRWGIRVAIGVSSPDPAPTAGGIAGLGSFNWSTDTPCYVFPQRLGNSNKSIADATVHEVGHTLGLDHDGLLPDTALDSYYQGHGSGPTAWAPHMGVGYYVNLVQWGKGEYLGANNLQDDLAIITSPMNNGFGGPNGFNYRPDDFGSTSGVAAPLAGTVNAGVITILQNGVIEKRADADWFKINVGTGTISLSATGGPVNTMLDIQMDLYNSSGTLLQSSNPATALTASINRTVAAGTYYVVIDGVGNGDPLATGYTDYGSLGQYTITGTAASGATVVGGNVVSAYNAGTKTLSLTGDTGSNSVSVKYILAFNTIEVAGLNGTKVNNKTTPASYPYTGPINFGAVMSDGNDSVYLTNVPATQVYLNLGNGNDQAGLSMCAVTDKLNADGGIGVNSLVTTTSTIPSGTNLIIKNITHIP